MRFTSTPTMFALLPALFAGASFTLAAQDTAPPPAHEHEDKDKAVQGGGTVPAGWSVRADEGGTAHAKVVPMGTGLHVTLGPAIILYRDTHDGNGPFHTLATFTQTKNPSHPEGYGLFFGGKALNGAGQRYTYFLVRGDGTYLVKRREGEKTSQVTKGWAADAAVHKADAKGKATNRLEIDAKRDPNKIVFMANGKVVYTMDAKEADVNGVVGLRVNHNLDVHIDGFDVHR
jgi:hypothetical protein